MASSYRIIILDFWSTVYPRIVKQVTPSSWTGSKIDVRSPFERISSCQGSTLFCKHILERGLSLLILTTSRLPIGTCPEYCFSDDLTNHHTWKAKQLVVLHYHSYKWPLLRTISPGSSKRSSKTAPVHRWLRPSTSSERLRSPSGITFHLQASSPVNVSHDLHLQLHIHSPTAQNMHGPMIYKNITFKFFSSSRYQMTHIILCLLPN